MSLKADIQQELTRAMKARDELTKIPRGTGNQNLFHAKYTPWIRSSGTVHFRLLVDPVNSGLYGRCIPW